MSDMVTVEVGTLEGPALDWAVAKCQGMVPDTPFVAANKEYTFKPSIDWAQGGPIIDRERIDTSPIGPMQKTKGFWKASCFDNPFGQVLFGETPLIAAMRCYVTSRFGNTMEIPAVLVPAPSTERRARP